MFVRFNCDNCWRCHDCFRISHVSFVFPCAANNAWKIFIARFWCLTRVSINSRVTLAEQTEKKNPIRICDGNGRNSDSTTHGMASAKKYQSRTNVNGLEMGGVFKLSSTASLANVTAISMHRLIGKLTCIGRANLTGIPCTVTVNGQHTLVVKTLKYNLIHTRIKWNWG